MIEDRKGEHAPEPGQHLGRLAGTVLVEVDQDLGVAVGAKAMAVAFELVAQLDRIVELAVVGDPDVARLVAKRLIGLWEKIDDAKPVCPSTQVECEPARVFTPHASGPR